MTKFPSDRFAAFLAHHLTSEATSALNIDVGFLYASLMDALAKRYRLDLLSHASFGVRMSADEAAERYFEATLARALWLSNRVDTSLSHRIFLSMCLRGIDSEWAGSRLHRIRSSEGFATAYREGIAFLGWSHVSRSLARLPKETSTGNPANAIRRRDGMLWLFVGDVQAEVPEEMSIWSAIGAGPTRVKSLGRGEEFNRFCGLLIDALRTAHRPYQEIIGLARGLCPFDWFDVLSVNQVRGLRRFLQGISGPDTIESWTGAWGSSPVPGFKAVRDLWDSEIGYALRLGKSTFSQMSVDSIEDMSDQGSEILSESEFEKHVKVLQDRGVINEAEAWILQRLYIGDTLLELSGRLEVKKLLIQGGLKLPALLSDLQQRIEAWRGAEAACDA